jgi:hypothetical protein
MKELFTRIDGEPVRIYADNSGNIQVEKVEYIYSDLYEENEPSHSQTPVYIGKGKNGLNIYIGIKKTPSVFSNPGATIFLCDREGHSLYCGAVVNIGEEGMNLHPCIDENSAPFPLVEDGMIKTSSLFIR